MKIKFVLQDCWIGLYWKSVEFIERPVCHCGDYCDTHNFGSGHSPVPMPEPPDSIRYTWYLCIIPCFPIIWNSERILI